MIYQTSFISSNPYIAIATILLVSIIVFTIGILITRWRAIFKNWNDSFKKAGILNLLWLIVNVFFYSIFNFIQNGIFLALVISLLINLFIGSLLALYLYNKDYKESVVFILVILLYLFIIGLFVGFITLIIISLISAGLTMF
ncbi:MAG: hypothetical protein ACFFCI_25500 [Promethearchaeota archaeon]